MANPALQPAHPANKAASRASIVLAFASVYLHRSNTLVAES
jgi:hypothetical protein